MEAITSPAEVRKTCGQGEVPVPMSGSRGVKGRGSPGVGCRRLWPCTAVHRLAVPCL